MLLLAGVRTPADTKFNQAGTNTAAATSEVIYKIVLSCLFQLVNVELIIDAIGVP